MSTYKEVKAGDTFQPSASTHNDLVRMLNAFDGPKAGQGSSGSKGVTVLKVYNPTNTNFAPGIPVNFDNDSPLVNEHVPIKAYEDKEAPWGVLLNGLQANSFGSCIVSGPVTVTVSSGEGKYAEPTESGFAITDSPEGNFAQVLYTKDTQAVICLGAGGSADKIEELAKKFEYPPPAISGITIGSDNTYDSIKQISYVDWITGETKTTIVEGINLTLGQGFDLPSGVSVVGLCAKTNGMEVDGDVDSWE